MIAAAPHIWTPPKWLTRLNERYMAHLKKASSGHLLKTSGGHLSRGCPAGNYLLSDCAGIKSDICTDTDLSAYVDQVIKIDSEGDTCWAVSGSGCTPDRSVIVSSSSSTCSNCLPNCCEENNYCVSLDATVDISVSLTVNPSNGTGCLCRSDSTSGTDIELVNCFNWSLTSSENPTAKFYTCDPGSGSQGYIFYVNQIAFRPNNNDWEVSFVFAEDKTNPISCSYNVLIPGDICGCSGTITENDPNSECCQWGSYEATVDITVKGNQCCYDGSTCTHGDSNCDSTCNTAP